MLPALAVTTPPASSLRRRRPDRVGGAADLEGADRLQVLELQPDLVGRRRAAGRAACGPRRPRSARARARSRRAGSRSSELDGRAGARSRARGRSMYSAAARSSTARPSDLKTVISSSEVRPGYLAGEHLAELCPDVVRADRALLDREEVVAGLVARTTRGGRRTASRARSRRLSSSRAVGRLAPTAFTCAPGAAIRRRTTGSRDEVTVQTTSASRRASSTVSTATARGHSAASRSALSRLRAAILICSNCRASSIAAMCGVRLVAGSDDRQHLRVLSRQGARRDAGDRGRADRRDRRGVHHRDHVAVDPS